MYNLKFYTETFINVQELTTTSFLIRNNLI